MSVYNDWFFLIPQPVSNNNKRPVTGQYKCKLNGQIPAHTWFRQHLSPVNAKKTGEKVACLIPVFLSFHGCRPALWYPWSGWIYWQVWRFNQHSLMQVCLSIWSRYSSTVRPILQEKNSLCLLWPHVVSQNTVYSKQKVMYFKLLLLLIVVARDKAKAAHWLQPLPKQQQHYFVMPPQVLIWFYAISAKTWAVGWMWHTTGCDESPVTSKLDKTQELLWFYTAGE